MWKLKTKMEVEILQKRIRNIDPLVYYLVCDYLPMDGNATFHKKRKGKKKKIKSSFRSSL